MKIFKKGEALELNNERKAKPMTLIFYANPYDLSAEGFYFQTYDDYLNKAKALRNDYGNPVEEFEIEFINGDDLDCALAKAWGLSQGNIKRFIDAAEDWDDFDKKRFIIAVGECGYAFNPDHDRPDDLYDVDIYAVDSLKELAEQFVDEGLFGDIPERLASYIDYEAIARDLAHDYTETEIAGERLIYRAN